MLGVGSAGGLGVGAGTVALGRVRGAWLVGGVSSSNRGRNQVGPKGNVC